MVDFSRLPSKVISIVVKYINSSDCANLRLASQQWNQQIQESYYFSYNIINEKVPILTLCQRQGRKIGQLTLTDVTQSLISSSGPGSQEPPTQVVQSLTLKRILVLNNLTWTLNTFRGLTKLTFYRVILPSVSRNMLGIRPGVFELPSLTTLVFCSRTGYPAPIINEPDEPFIQLADDFPQDELMILDMLAYTTYKRLKNVTLFCSAKVLRSIPLSEIFMRGDYFKMTSLSKIIYNNRGTLTDFYAGPAPGQFTVAIRFIPVDFNVSGSRALAKIAVFDCFVEIPLKWNGIFETQSNLQFIRTHGAYQQWTGLQNGILKSHSTLVEVHLSGGGSGSSINLSVFEACKSLQWLEINLDDCYLENLLSLPTSVLKLSLNGPLSSEDLVSIALRLLNLKTLYLNDNLPSNKHTFYGDKQVIPGNLTIFLLKAFFQMRYIERLSFRQFKMPVASVLAWLETLTGLEAKMFPVEGYPQESIASLSISILK